MKTPHYLKSSLTRYALGFALFLLPLGASALDLTPDASRVISDPAYLPLGGQLYGSTEYSNASTSSSTADNLGAFRSANNSLSNIINQVFEYSVTDDFTLRVSDSYEWNTSTTSFPDGTNTVTNSNGFIDPSFGLVWRVLDQRDNSISWDLLGSYSPNFISAQSADPTENGNVARGGDTETFGTALSYKMRDFTLYLEGTAAYLDNRAVLNPANQITTSYDSSWQYYLLVSTQTRFAPQWSINVGLSETFNDSVGASYVNGGGTLVSSSNTPGDVTDIILALNFQAIPNQFVMSFVYNHDFYNNSINTNFTFPGNSTTNFDKDEDVLSGELRYVFN